MNNLVQAMKFVEERANCKIDFTISKNGYYWWWGKNATGGRYIWIAGNSPTMICHELGHILAGHATDPISKISSLIRELDAWRVGEALQYKFSIPFDGGIFSDGIDTYIYDLMGSDESPSFKWLSQLFGDKKEENQHDSLETVSVEAC